MENKFKELMSQRSNDELIKMVTDDRERHELAEIEAADIELKNRDLNIFRPKDDFVTSDVDMTKATEPLGTISKALCFILPGIILIMLSDKYKSGGYKRKSKEMKTWTIYGFGFYFGLLLFINSLSWFE